MISDQVHEVIMDFYEASKHLHITLDEETVAKKMLRIYDKVNDLGKYATCCNTARLKLKWKQNGYKECIIENFHFAFQIYQDENDESFVYVIAICIKNKLIDYHPFDRPADRHQHPLVSSTVVAIHFADVFTIRDLFGIGRRMGTE